MARFVSKYPRYAILVQAEKTRLTADGYTFTSVPSRIAEFVQGGVLNWETEYAKTHLPDATLGGAVPEGLDATLRYSVFDTGEQNFTPEEREQVEDALRTSRSLGIDYTEVFKPKLAAPWPNYDAVTNRGPKALTAVIADKVRDDGYDPEHVIAYEEENLNRPEVIAAVRALQVPEEDEILA